MQVLTGQYLDLAIYVEIQEGSTGSVTVDRSAVRNPLSLPVDPIPVTCGKVIGW